MSQDPSGISKQEKQKAEPSDSRGRAQTKRLQPEAAAPPPPLFQDVPPGGGPAFKDQARTVQNAATGDVQNPPNYDLHRRGDHRQPRQAGGDGVGGPVRVVSYQDAQQHKNYEIVDLDVKVRSMIGRSPQSENANTARPAQVQQSSYMDPPDSAQEKETRELPKPAMFPDIAPDSDKRPSFKDQVRTARQAPAQRFDGNPDAARGSPNSRLPMFKDQARGTAAELRGETPGGNENIKDFPLPLFKDQVGAHNVSPSGHRLPDIEQDRPELPAEMTPSPLISAHVVEDEAPAEQNTIYEAEALVGGIMVFLNRRCIIAASAILLVVAATIGGVCGAGLCSSGGTTTTLFIASTPSPTVPSTPEPTPEPTPAPTIGPEAQVIVDFVNSVTFADEEITYPFQLGTATPEQLALRWLIDEDPLELNVDNEADQKRIIQRYALLTFWYSTNGQAWSENDKWLETEDECTWFGITCNQNSVVIQIGSEEESFAGNNLVGHLPADLALLEFTRSLSAANNPELTGPIPPSVGALRELTSVWLNGCNLNGSLPDSLGQLNKLQFLELSHNTLTSTLPSTVSQLTSLTNFLVASNQLSGSLPDHEGWRNLIGLALFENKFNQTLPSSIGSWSNLAWFHINNNDFSGTLPSTIGNWVRLEEFLIGYNNLSGSLPASIGNWTKLETFQIYGADPVTTEVFPDNHFDSALPDTIGQWRSITLFDVSQQDDNHPTSFTGTLPESISQWTDLEMFAAFNNAFTGTLSDSIGAWSNLGMINIAMNAFTGSLPASIGNWTNLEVFSCGGNFFNGTIPETIASWQKITAAAFHGNDFTGTVPTGICAAPNIHTHGLYADCVSQVVCQCCDACYNGTAFVHTGVPPGDTY